MKIVVAGGTGFLGKILINHFRKESNLFVLTRGESFVNNCVSYIHWDAKTVGDWALALERADAVINLTGKSVDCRYNEANRQLIYSSRLDSTAAIGKAILQCKKPPKVWINSGSATIYRHSEDKEMDERNGELGSGFSVEVCRKWEETFNRFNLLHTRKIILRTGIVLGEEGGPLKPLCRLAKTGFGGRQGSGNQFVSWLHKDDFAAIVDFLITNENLNGVFNVTAPTPLWNVQFMKDLRESLGVKVYLPMPKWLLELGAVIIQTETELILKSRRVVPRRLLEAGFEFKYPSALAALKDLCSKTNNLQRL